MGDWDRQSYRQSVHVHTPRTGHAYSSILEMDDDSGSGGAEVGTEEEEYYEPAPHKPSAKALGKRRVIEPEETDSAYQLTSSRFSIYVWSES